LRPGGELDVVRHSGLPAPLTIIGPGLRQVDAPVDQRVTVAAREGQEHADLGILDPPGGAGVLALHPDGVHALLQIAGLVDDQDPVWVTELVDDDLPQIVSHGVGIPLRPVQQALHRIRPSVSCLLSHLPQVLIARSARSPSTNPAAARRGSTRANRPANESITRSMVRCH
jgi:hypothetical protein